MEQRSEELGSDKFQSTSEWNNGIHQELTSNPGISLHILRALPKIVDKYFGALVSTMSYTF